MIIKVNKVNDFFIIKPKAIVEYKKNIIKINMNRVEKTGVIKYA